MWNPFRRQQPKLGLALGSGGAKGMAHLGALKAFEEENITFDLVTGTSIGSIVGAAYASGMNWKEIYDKIGELDFTTIRKRGILAQITMTDSGNIERAVASVLGENTRIEDLQKPFSAVAVDLRTGEEVVLSQGNVAKAVTASSAVAPVFTPVVYGERHLVDGAYLNPIPADVCRAMGADIVVSIDLSSKKSATTDSVKMLDVLLTSVKIAMKNATYKGYHNSDFVIHPDLSAYSSSKFDGIYEMFEIGYEETKKRMPEILAMLRAHRYRLPEKRQTSLKNGNNPCPPQLSAPAETGKNPGQGNAAGDREEGDKSKK